MINSFFDRFLNSKYFATLTYGISLTCATFGAVYAAIVHRPMLYDGSAWYYLILTRGSYYDKSFTRYFSLVLEWPATFLLKFYPQLDASTVIRVIDFAFACHPLVSLYCCYLILEKKNRKELFIFPVLSYATATISTLAFGVGVVPESLSLFWPLLFVLHFRDGQSWKENVWGLVLIVSLMLTYEVSVIFFGILFLVQILRIRKQKNPGDFIFLAFITLAASYCVYRILGPTLPFQPLFWVSLKKPLRYFRRYIFTMIMGFFLLLWSLRKPPKNNLPLIIFSIFSLSALYCIHRFYLENFDLGAPYFARVTAIPFAAAIALGYLFIFQFLQEQEKMRKLLSGLPVLFVSWVLIGSSIYDYKFSEQWSVATADFYQKFKDSKGCFQHELQPHMVTGWHAPYLSTLLQENKKISWIVFNPADPVDRCKAFVDGYISDGFTEHRVDNPYFDFSIAVHEAERIQALKQK